MKILFYPIIKKDKNITKNPYTFNFIKHLEISGFSVINKEKPYDFFKSIFFINKFDLVILNWIEDICDKRYGYIQNLLFFMNFFIWKIFKKKVIWIVHNKISHNKKNKFLKIINFYLLSNYADVIISHSSEGIMFVKTFWKVNTNNKTVYIDHPTNGIFTKASSLNRKYDILIWGNITSYKGVDIFLEKYYKEIHKYNLKLLIAGKILDNELKKKLLRFKSSNILINDDFVSNTELKSLISESKIILFPYIGVSTLSSGAMIYSLEHDGKVLGPNIGEFKDLGEREIIFTYGYSENIIEKILKILQSHSLNDRQIEEFVKTNTWKNFIDKLNLILKEKK